METIVPNDDDSNAPSPVAVPTLPEWCNVYEGLSDMEIADIERAILPRADLRRPTE